MNRLIIIGNGFDLAHGYKSSSKDLILYYLRKVWKNMSLGEYDDRLIRIQNCGEYFRNEDINYNDDNAIEIFKKIDKKVVSGKDATLNFKSNFFRSIFYKIESLNWADFETEYFNELIYLIDTNKKKKNRDLTYDRVKLDEEQYSSIRKLNKDLDYLRDFLIEDLKIQEVDFLSNGKIDKLYTTIFNEELTDRETNISSDPKKIYFLNFNYTKTLEKYIKNDFGVKNINYIHGTLDKDPIFGFGDDTSERYNELENEYNNEFLRKIKSFKYLDNSKYQNLKKFIESDKFQVQIFGHSCGVSDRTLFKQIFEHKNCDHIMIFYYDKNDFNEKTYELSRHFQDKISFLEKVLPFNKLRPMPQPCKTKVKMSVF